PRRSEAELAAVRAEIAELKATLATQSEAFARYRDEMETQLAWIRQPDDLHAVKAFMRALDRNGKDLPDDVHEKALRLEPKIKPYDFELSRALAALLSRSDRPPMPDQMPEEGGGNAKPDDSLGSLVGLADAYASAEDTFRAYAALWQACVRYPADPRGWAEY